MNKPLFLISVAMTLAVSSLSAGAQSAVPDRSVLVRFHSPSVGDAGAKVEIVEFFDPACEACAAFYPFVKQLMEEHRGRVRLTIRYAPYHRGADQIVRLLEASRRQGKYAETLDAIVASQERWAINHSARLDLALKSVERVGLQMDRLRSDMASPDLARLIQQDMKDGVTLNVTGTPTFFVNGRPLTKLGYDELRAAVAQAVREHYVRK